VRINKENTNKTMFIYGNYKFTVEQFGLSNSPIVFMCLMNGVFKEYLDKFLIVFMDDIFIYSNTKE